MQTCNADPSMLVRDRTPKWVSNANINTTRTKIDWQFEHTSRGQGGEGTMHQKKCTQWTYGKVKGLPLKCHAIFTDIVPGRTIGRYSGVTNTHVLLKHVVPVGQWHQVKPAQGANQKYMH